MFKLLIMMARFAVSVTISEILSRSTEIINTFIKEINEMKHLFGQGVKEPLICVKNIDVYAENTIVMGKNFDCWKVTDDEGFEIVNFGVDAEKDPMICAFHSNDDKTGLLGTIDMIGKVDISEYKGILTPQFVVKDYVLKREG